MVCSDHLTIVIDVLNVMLTWSECAVAASAFPASRIRAASMVVIAALPVALMEQRSAQVFDLSTLLSNLRFQSGEFLQRCSGFLTAHGLTFTGIRDRSLEPSPMARL